LSDALHERRTRGLARLLEDTELPLGEPHPCPYLPGRTARQLVVQPPSFAPGLYHAFMDLNFRRLGPVVYRPACPSCRECRSLRIPVREFRPSRAQRRCAVRNAEVSVEIGPPEPTAEKHDLYRRYLAARHDGQMTGSAEEFHQFLYDAPPLTLELTYRWQGRLLAVGIADLEPEALSAVYCYFDPEAPGRSLGILNVLALLGECRRRDLPYLYLGYWVPGSPTMAYKAHFRPHELLEGGVWVRPGGRPPGQAPEG
jgi:arginine-tRNA-protein transferase